MYPTSVMCDLHLLFGAILNVGHLFV